MRKVFSTLFDLRHFSGRMRLKAVSYRIWHPKNTILFAKRRNFLPCRIESNLVIFDYFQYLLNRVELPQTSYGTLALKKHLLQKTNSINPSDDIFHKNPPAWFDQGWKIQFSF